VPKPEAVHTGQVETSLAHRPPREIELKLSVSPEAMETLCNAEPVLRHARNRGVTRRLDAVYYDTPDRLFDRSGMSLRIRRSGHRHIQTLKRSGAGDPLARDEWEVALPDGTLDLARLPLDELGEPFSALSAENLAPVFATRFRRRLRRVDYRGAQIEVAFDDGAIQAGEKTLPICEIELELKGGDAAALYEFGLALLEVAPLQVAMRSKSERGYGLALARAPRATRAEPVELAATDNADAAIAAILRSTYHQLLGNLAAAGASETEGIHQMRVSLRRLRSALAIFDKEIAAPALGPLADDAKRLGHVLGPARDWDVFATQTVPDVEAGDLGNIGLSELLRAAEPFRAAGYEAVSGRLADPAVTRFLLSFGCVIERSGWRSDLPSDAMQILAEPATDVAGRILSRIHRKALRRGRGFRKLGPDARHRLRLALKRLRYAAEFFLPLYQGPKATRYLARLSRLQDALGLANDAATTIALLDTLCAQAKQPRLHYAAGVLRGWQAHHGVAVSRKLRKRWRRFKALAPFWD